MARIWTSAQSAAINIHHKTLLVSAAAGSGKTATLTERIIRSITDSENPADISKMLIVTFTRAAAEELKSRIFTAISEALAKDPGNRHLNGQLIKLGSANICTIDSFCLNLLRANFSSLGLPASFRIADETELELLSQSVMEETIELFYETDDRFPAFAECFTGTRNTDQLASILIDLERKSTAIPQGIEFFRTNAEEMKRDAEAGIDFFSTSFGKILREHAIDTVTHAHTIFSSACEYIAANPETTNALFAAYDSDRTFCEALLGALNDPIEAYELSRKKLQNYAPLSLKTLKKEYVTEETERFKALRTTLKEELRSLSKDFFFQSKETILHALKDTAEYTDLLYRVLLEYQNRLTNQKRNRQILDFNDTRRYTFELLVDKDGLPTPTAKQYAKEFSDIYIDEYQDVDLVQDQIFAALATKTNRFMVGDIKQSIYGFRGAEPKVFSHYRSTFPDYEEEDAKNSDTATIFMSENFRCDEPIIRFTNLICGRIFSACSQSIDYQSKDDLIYSKGSFDPRENAPAVEVAVISTKSETTPSDKDASSEEAPVAKELEAAYIAEEIERLISSETKGDGTPIQAGDIAVLFRSRTMSPYVANALKQRGILCSESDHGRYFENPDVLMLLCLLNTVDNPHRDIFLTGTLRSPLFGFDMNEIVDIRSSASQTYSLYDALLCRAEENDELAEKCRRFDEELQAMRRDARSMPVDRFLRTLFESERMIASGLLCDISTGEDRGNLLRLYDYARTFEAGSFKGLYNFIEFINTVIEEEKTMKIPPKGTSPDRVNLMTIHQSKGLEFPVCFVCGTASKFNRKDQSASFLFEYPSGVAMKISDTTGLARINTPMREALAIQNGIRQSEEEMRVLYVALTRARERLYVTASTSSAAEKLQEKAISRMAFCDRYTVLRCNSYLDWILLSFADPNADLSCAKLSLITPTELAQTETKLEACPAPAEEAIRSDAELLAKLQKDFAFQYPYRDLQRIPAKLSVSRLSPSVLDENDDSQDLFPERKTQIPDFFLSDRPSRVSATERGTATHVFLQFCDFSYAERHGVKEELARLVEKKFLPQNFMEILYPEELESFLQSDLFQEIKCAERIIREQRFNLFLSPEAFTQDEAFRKKLHGEKLAVQGVIDLILIDRDGNVSLFDYKTDRLTKEERSNERLAQTVLQKRHGLQLSYYAHAVQELFGRPCQKVCVYSTHAGKLFDITPTPLTFTADLLDTL